MASKRRSYGSGSVYKNRDKWVVKVYQDHKPAYIYGFKTKAEALTALKAKNNQENELTIENYYKIWLERRKVTNRSWSDDNYRWQKHLNHLNNQLPSSITVSDIKDLVETKLKEGLSPTTIRLIVKLLSSFLNNLVENQVLSSNVIATLPKSVKRLFKPVYNWASTPFVTKLEDVDRILKSMTGELKLAYAIAVSTGIRPGELLGLRSEDIDLVNKRIIIKRQLQKGAICDLKDNEHRIIPIMNKLEPYLVSLQPGFIIKNYTKGDLRKGLRKVLKKLNMRTLNWYQSTRHTFSSLFIINGGSVEKLSKILGHSDLKTTQRYYHLTPDSYSKLDYSLMGL